MASSPFSYLGTQSVPTNDPLTNIAKRFTSPGVYNVPASSDNPYGLSLNPQTAKPTSVVSSSIAANKVNTQIKPVLTDAQATSEKKKAASTAAAESNINASTSAGTDQKFITQTRVDGNGNPYTVSVPNPNYIDPSTQTQPTNTDQQMTDAALHPGQTQYFNNTTGAPEWLPTSPTGAPTGYSTQSPKTRTDVTATVDAPGGITYKQFSDGTYGRFDLTSGGYTQANAADFQQAKSYSTAQKQLEDLQNGILTPMQQTLLNSIKQQWQSLIDKQTTINANATGTQTIAQNLFGMGSSIS